MKKEYQKDSEAKRWNHRPDGPVALNPLFERPLKFMAVLRWYSSYWLAASTTTLALVLAVTAYFTILPSLEAMQKLQLDWIIKVWFANFIPHTLCAGMLHLWLYNSKDKKTILSLIHVNLQPIMVFLVSVTKFMIICFGP